jgi:hypothetical protein
MNTTTTEHRTSDLSLAAYLLARGYPLLGTGGDARRRVFAFPAGVEDDAKAYYAGASVGARAFANALRDLKTLIREA